jgi:hypothetical protein
MLIDYENSFHRELLLANIRCNHAIDNQVQNVKGIVAVNKVLTAIIVNTGPKNINKASSDITVIFMIKFRIKKVKIMLQ